MKFELFNLNTIDSQEFESYGNKNLFTTLQWLNFLYEWKHVRPVIVRISADSGELIGHFTGCIFKKFGMRMLGSPFYGWMGQHMGFDFVDPNTVDKSKVLDDLICFLKTKLKIIYMIFADFQYLEENVIQCKTPLFYNDIRGSFFIDLTQSEEQLFKNFKSGYRTCVRKFEKMGGTIVQDISSDFIEEHHKQLKDVFMRKSMTPPNYRERMELMYQEYPDMVLSIKALDENGNNIASSYYFASGTIAFFASNASRTDSLQYNANQALMWYAIKYWKSKGYKTLDLAGRSPYKENFGSILLSTPTIVWTKYSCLYKIIQFARNTYYQMFRLKFKLKAIFTRNK